MAKVKNNPKEVVNEKIIEEVLSSELTDKEQNFILFYLESNNAMQSYLKAYGGDKKYAGVAGYNVLRRPKVKSEMKRMKKIMQIGMDVDPSKYLETLLKAANADIGDYIKFAEEEVPEFNDEGLPLVNPDTGEPIVRKVNRMHLEDSKNLDTSLITEVKQGRDGISIKLVDKLKAWEKLKEFFEWKKQQEDSSKATNNLIEVLTAKTEDTWEDDDEGTKDTEVLGD